VRDQVSQPYKNNRYNYEPYKFTTFATVLMRSLKVTKMDLTPRVDFMLYFSIPIALLSYARSHSAQKLYESDAQ
jgi:hypothetical protein